MVWWSTSSGKIELNITKVQASSCVIPGCDATSEVEALRQVPAIKRQLDKLDPVLVAEELKEYGAWDDDELKDEFENITRLLWIACGDVNDGNI